MNQPKSYQGLQFERHTPAAFRRLIPIGAALALFTLLWGVVPHSVLYWLLLVVVAALIWMASYGWRQAIAALIALLHRLEEA